MHLFTLLSVAAALMLVGCARHHENMAVIRADSLKRSVGQRVTVVGVAESRKLGAALRCDGFEVWLDGVPNWPSGYANRKVEVVGVLEERFDLPVFVQKPGELAVQGMPVPEGTDLHEASRRYVVSDASWSVLR